MTGHRLGRHRASTSALARFDVPVTSGSVVVGQGQGREPVAVQLFRSRPTHVALVTSGYVARLLAWRALATGALVQAVTSRPHSWTPLVGAVPPSRMRVAPPGSPPLQGSGADAPMLRCEDGGPDATRHRSAIGPWQAVLAVHDFAIPRAVAALTTFDLVVLQRIAPELVQSVQRSFGLPEEFVTWLPRLPDNTVALITASHARLVSLGLTQLELDVLGPPTRHDG